MTTDKGRRGKAKTEIAAMIIARLVYELLNLNRLIKGACR